MAHNARVAALTDELITSILDFDTEKNKQAYKHAKEIAARGLKAHQYARTNQFEVESKFEGLDEKFRVLNRDHLADALQLRLKELQGKRSQWKPEFLDLLLKLSDQPAQKSNVEALQLLRPPTPPPELTWKQMLEKDPYSDEEIWKDIEYGVESSEDERTPKRKEKDKPSPPTSVEEDDTYDPEACVVSTTATIIKEIEKAQFWKQELREEEERIEITELQAVRETLFMLAGLQTSLFQTDKQNNSIRVNQKYALSHAIQRTADHLFSQLADMGRELYGLRQWTKRSSTLPLIQTFEATVRRRLAEYDHTLAQLQRQYLVPDVPIAVSLLQLHDKLRTISRPILRLASVVADIEPQLLVNPFIHLETLFDQINLAQMSLEKDVFDFLSKIFFECLATYQKPIRRWMESGELGENDETFFVFENDSSSEVSSLWHDRFVLRRGKENALRSPTFLQPAAQRIFNTGKSVVFLKELGIYGTGLESTDPEPSLDHETVCGSDSEMPLSPFSELFQIAFQRWIKSKYSLASTVLREHLFKECGLMKILDDFKILYLGADGSVFQDFADAVFERMDAGQRGWNDRFLLTELARGMFSTALGRSNAEKIVVRSTRSKTQSQSVKGLENVSIDYATPWAITNILQRPSLPIYQQLSTLLLQTYRAKYLLQRIPLTTISHLQSPPLRQQSFKLRHRLIWFADILRSYLTETVIRSCIEDMNTVMQRAEDIDEMADIHTKFVARLQERALLSANLKPIHKAVISILDLAVLYAEIHAAHETRQANVSTHASTSCKPKLPKSPVKAAKGSRRKSVIPAIVEDESSGSEADGDEERGGESEDEKAKENSGVQKGASSKSFQEGLDVVDRELGSLLPFVTAGLRSVGRVGAEAGWEMLAERLEWEGRERVV